jgi:16S rRNA (guanine966-N2)-methyltransferase
MGLGIMSYVRIISGALKKQKIITPGHTTHPMGGREKLALFNSIQNDLPAATVLDVFAGSGALGIEALSRGAALVTFVETHPRAIAAIGHNLANLGLLSRATITRTLPAHQLFNIIFADPPYQDPHCSIVVRLPALLVPGGLLILSFPKNVTPPVLPLALLSSRSYAAATIRIYQNALMGMKSL